MSTQPRRIEYMRLSDLVPDEMNPKDHDLDIIGESVHRFGFIDPIILDERTGKLISGHGRLETLQAAFASGHPLPEGLRKDGDGWAVPVSRGWASADAGEARAALVALNRTVEMGGWDDEALAAILDAQNDRLDGLGYDEHDVTQLVDALNTEGGGASTPSTSIPQREDDGGEREITPAAPLATVVPEFDGGGVELDEGAHTCPRCRFTFDD